MAALTLTTGLVVQPFAARLDHTGSARATLAAVATVIAGLLTGALAVHRGSVVLVPAAAVVLGAGYGLTLVSGLKETERLTPEHARPSAASLYQGTTSIGFLAPLLLAVTAGSVSYPALLVAMAAVGLLCLVVTAAYSRRHLPATDGVRPGSSAAAPPPGAPAVVAMYRPDTDHPEGQRCSSASSNTWCPSPGSGTSPVPRSPATSRSRPCPRRSASWRTSWTSSWSSGAGPTRD